MADPKMKDVEEVMRIVNSMPETARACMAAIILNTTGWARLEPIQSFIEELSDQWKDALGRRVTNTLR